MDYKEKYEQALKIAQETYNTQPMYRDWLEKMFPELSGGEDEKIRRVLIDFFEDWRENRSHCWGIAVSKILAWLENIPVTIDHEKREGFHLGYRAGFEKQVEQKPTDEEMKTLLRTEYEKGRADVIAKMQKEWSEEDEKKRKCLIKGLEDRMGFGWAGDTFSREEYINWLKSLRPQNNWKPSDEQMELLSEVQNALLGKDCHNRFTDFMWELKKLKEGKI